MSYSVAPAPSPRTRPGVVSTASMLLYVSALLLLVSAVLGFMQVGPVKESADVVYADQPDVLSVVGTGVTIAFVVIGVIYLVLATGLVVLGLLDGKGKQPARVITWVVAGLGVLCLGCSTASAGLTKGMGLGTGNSGNAAESEELARLVAEKTPSWVGATSTTVVVISLILMIAVIILLALPAANDFFRKEQQVWVPPTVWPGDPSLPPTLPPPPPGAL
jgi:hypothetical protein